MPSRPANRYDDAADLMDDDDDMELWMEMSEEEQERELATTMREFGEWWKTLTPAQVYRTRRRSNLRQCIQCRRHIKQTGFSIFLEMLRSAQKRLVEIRTEYYQRAEVGHG